MNTKYIALAGLGIVLLAIGGLFFYARGTTPPAQENSTVAEKKEEPDSKTLLGLLSLGKTQQCTFMYADGDGDGSTEGTMYFSGNKMRGDMELTDSDGKKSTFSIIRNGDTNYIWGSDLEGGIKMTLPADEFSENDQAKGFLDVEKEVDYKCSSWAMDATKFNPPSNLKFLDLSSFGVTQPKSTSGGSQNQCASCNSLTGEAKTYCLQQLGC